MCRVGGSPHRGRVQSWGVGDWVRFDQMTHRWKFMYYEVGNQESFRNNWSICRHELGRLGPTPRSAGRHESTKGKVTATPHPKKQKQCEKELS